MTIGESLLLVGASLRSGNNVFVTEFSLRVKGDRKHSDHKTLVKLGLISLVHVPFSLLSLK